MVAIQYLKQTPLSGRIRDLLSSIHYVNTLSPPIFACIIRDLFVRMERFDLLILFLTTLVNRAKVVPSIPSYLA
jgi:hypothetical protein